MSPLDTSLPSHDSTPKVDKNTIKWSGYFTTSEQAQEELEDKTKRFANTEDKLVLSAKKEFVNRHFKGYFLYRFVVILTNK
jgi:hypothetical protein